MTIEPEPLTSPAVQALDAQASALMKRGIRLLNEPQPEAVREALTCFDAALGLRRQLPFEATPSLRYGLAACWLNRAEALMRLGDEHEIVVALQAYDEALLLLRSLPLADDPRYPRRLAVAHQNRGLALHARGGSAPASAVAALTDAIAVLEHESAAPIADRQYLRAAVWMNLANVWVSEATVESDAQARMAARRAIALVEAMEDNNLDAAEVGLKARHVLCQALVGQLSLSVGTMSEEVHDATDLVDNGLTLARRWERQGIDRFRNVADDLFRFGARVYAMYQPHFLNEFLSENVDRTRPLLR